MQKKFTRVAIDYFSLRKRLPVDYCDTAVPGIDGVRKFELPMGSRVIFYLIHRDEACFLDIRAYPATEVSSVKKAASLMKQIIDAEYLRKELEEKGHSPEVIDFEVDRFLGLIKWEPIGSPLG